MKGMRNGKGIIAPAAIYIYLLIVTALLLYAAVVLYQHFPNMYTWEELFINYEGGFIRRGLLGQLLFLADRVMPVSIGYLVLYTVLFYAFLYVSYKKLTSVFDQIVVAFLFLSPLIFLLPVTDRYVFGRKDVFIEIILLCVAHVCVTCLTQEKAPLYKNTLLISLLFMTGMLIHETIIFYFPLFAVLLGIAYARQKKVAQWLCVTGILFSTALLLFAVIFVGGAGMREAICASWRQSYPGLTCEKALRFIGISLHFNITNAFQFHMNRVTLGSVCLGAFLGGMPLLFLWKAYRPYAAIRELLSASFVLRLAFWPAAFAPIIALAINIDYGRFLSIAFVSYLFFLYAVFAVRPQAAAPWLHKLKEVLAASPRLRCAAYLFAMAYGLCWRMVHFQPNGESLVIPGVLLYLQ
jgi:hypothetical protein